MVAPSATAATDTLYYPGERYFRHLQQLAFGGDNAEAYWSYDGKAIVFQPTSVKDGVSCDQIFYGKVPQRGNPFTYQLVSSGKGRASCAFFYKRQPAFDLCLHT